MPASLTRDANGTERVTVVVTPLQKRNLQRRARNAGMSVSDYIRRQTLEADDLGPLLEQLRASTQQAEQALTSAFARLKAHDAALPQLEAAAREAVLQAHRA